MNPQKPANRAAAKKLKGLISDPAPEANVVAFADAGQRWLITLGRAPAFDVIAHNKDDSVLAHLDRLDPSAQHRFLPADPHGTGTVRVPVTVGWSDDAGGRESVTYEVPANGWRPGRR